MVIKFDGKFAANDPMSCSVIWTVLCLIPYVLGRVVCPINYIHHPLGSFLILFPVTSVTSAGTLDTDHHSSSHHHSSTRHSDCGSLMTAPGLCCGHRARPLWENTTTSPSSVIMMMTKPRRKCPEPYRPSSSATGPSRLREIAIRNATLVLFPRAKKKWGDDTEEPALS